MLTERLVHAGCLKGCTKCNIAGIYIPKLHKYIYPGCRRYLDRSHPFRTIRTDARFGGTCTQPPPPPTTHEFLMQAGNTVAEAREEGTKARDPEDPSKELGVTGIPSIPVLTQLEYWNWAMQELIDPMHICFNQGRLHQCHQEHVASF